MKFIVEDITNNYNVCVVDDYERALDLAKDYVCEMFVSYDKSSYQLKSHFHKDIRKHNLIGISISTIHYNKLDKNVRTNHFWGHITKEGKVVNKNE